MVVITRESDDIVLQLALIPGTDPDHMQPGIKCYQVLDRNFETPAVGDVCTPDPRWQYYPQSEDNKKFIARYGS